jgi:hypothetical protein
METLHRLSVIPENRRERSWVVGMVRSKNLQCDFSDALMPDTFQLRKPLDLAHIEPNRQGRVD